MIQFRMKLAKQNILVTCLYPEALSLCRDYILTEDDSQWEEPCITVSTQKEDIFYEKRKLEAADRKEGIPIRRFSEEYLETLAVYRKIAEEMIDRNILLFHGSCIAVDGQGYLFTAKSGTGKSTHTRLWREAFGSRAVMVNDDKPLMEITSDGVTVYGTPWDGKHHLSSPVSVPLKGLCILKRGGVNRIARITKREAYSMLLQQSFRPKNPARLMKSLELIDRLAGSAPLYELHCNMEPEAALTAYQGMQGQQKRR